MNASMEAFANSIQNLSREELLSLLVEMESDRQQDAAIIAEFRRTSRDMHQEYSQMEMELKGARAQLDDMRKKYSHVCEQNASLLKQLYGRRSEKLSGLESDIPEDYADPLSESAVPVDTDSMPVCPDRKKRAIGSSTGHHARKTPGGPCL